MGSQMILAGDFQGFGLFGADVVLGAFDAGMAEQELGRAQVAGFAVDVGREGPPQGMQPVTAAIAPGLLQPGPEQPPELAFAQIGVPHLGPCPVNSQACIGFSEAASQARRLSRVPADSRTWTGRALRASVFF